MLSHIIIKKRNIPLFPYHQLCILCQNDPIPKLIVYQLRLRKNLWHNDETMNFFQRRIHHIKLLFAQELSQMPLVQNCELAPAIINIYLNKQKQLRVETSY